MIGFAMHFLRFLILIIFGFLKLLSKNNRIKIADAVTVAHKDIANDGFPLNLSIQMKKMKRRSSKVMMTKLTLMEKHGNGLNAERKWPNSMQRLELNL